MERTIIKTIKIKVNENIMREINENIVVCVLHIIRIHEIN